MWEKIKSVVLVVLVAVSLVLTYLVWQGPNLGESSNKDEYLPLDSQPAPPIERVISPHSLYLVTEETTFLLRPGQEGYARLWQEIYAVLTSALAAGGVIAQEIPENILWEAVFPVPVPLGGIFAETITVTEEVGKHYLYLDGQEIYRFPVSGLPTIPPEDSRPFVVRDFSQELLSSHGIQIREPVAVPVAPPALPTVLLSRQEFPLEKLLRAVFIDPTMVRQVVREGDEIFTDGVKGLQISEGFAELTTVHSGDYPRPLADEDVLKQGADLINVYFQWPPDSYLLQLEPGSRSSYQMTLVPYYHGLPVRGEDFSLSVSFNSRGVTGFYFPFWGQVGEKQESPLPGLTDALALAMDAALDERTPDWLESVELVYLPGADSTAASALVVLEPAWEIVFDTGVYYVGRGGVMGP